MANGALKLAGWRLACRFANKDGGDRSFRSTLLIAQVLLRLGRGIG